MKIIKRNGSEVDFDLGKIVAAVSKANNACEKEELTPSQINDIAEFVEFKMGKANRALGAVVGILKGAVFAVVFCLLINLIISFVPNGFLIFTPENIADSYAFKLLAEVIPFIKF